MAKDRNNARYQSRAYTFGAILLAVVVWPTWRSWDTFQVKTVRSQQRLQVL